MTATDRNTAAASAFLGEQVIIAVRVSSPSSRRVNRIQAALAPVAFIPFIGIPLAIASSLFGFLTRRSNGSGTTGRQLLAFTTDGGRVLLDTESPLLAFGRETPSGIPRRLGRHAQVKVGTTEREHLGPAWPVTIDGVDLLVDGIDFKRLLKTVFEEGHDLPNLRQQMAREYRSIRAESATEPDAIRQGISDQELRRRNAELRQSKNPELD